MHIGSTNSLFGKLRGKHSYYFSKYPHILGWAFWRDRWTKFKFSFTDEDEIKLQNIFNEYKFSVKEMKYWEEHWNLVKHGNREDIWDIQWTFTCWLNNGITIVPNLNLISNIGGIPDMVRNGINGFLVDEKDHIGLAKQIMEILNNKDLREQMSENARNIAVQEYSQELQAKRYILLYQSILGL
jgi:glycosyltransferase involved in cell wall biosynthesis